MTSKASLIETELLRKKLYEKILANIFSLKLESVSGTKLTSKENSNLLLRFVFNKILSRKNSDDPVFIVTESEIAKKQLVEDFAYHKIINYDVNKFYSMLQESFVAASSELKTAKVEPDGQVKIEEGVLTYKNSSYPDIGKTGEKKPELVSNALALIIRYTYMRLLSHGLANDYASMGYKPDDDVSEGFANAFNHYFNKWYSAFPDLEAEYGSLGSFFEEQKFYTKTVMCNPPFDMNIMLKTINVAEVQLAKAVEEKREQRFVLTFPWWKDVKEFNDLKNNPLQVGYKIIPKSETRFIDYMKGVIVKPCDILEIKLESKR